MAAAPLCFPAHRHHGDGGSSGYGSGSGLGGVCVLCSALYDALENFCSASRAPSPSAAPAASAARAYSRALCAWSST
eukprot:2787545-Prymnesium_polylepis.1